MHIAIKTNEKSTKNKYFFKKISVFVMEFNFTVPSILKSFIFSFTNIVQTKPRMCFLQPNCGTRFNQIFGTLCLLSSLEQKRGSVKKHREVLKTSSLKVGFIINLGIKIICWEKFIFLEIRKIPMQAIAYIIFVQHQVRIRPSQDSHLPISMKFSEILFLLLMVNMVLEEGNKIQN